MDAASRRPGDDDLPGPAPGGPQARQGEAPQEFTAVVDTAFERFASDEPLAAEVAAAALVASARVGDEFDIASVEQSVGDLEARGGPLDAQVLRAMAWLARGRAGRAAVKAARRLAAAGVPAPSWAAELAGPARLAECWHVPAPSGARSMLGGVFARAGRRHGFLLAVDDDDCGAARDLRLVLGPALERAWQIAVANAEVPGAQLVTLEPAEFRWRAEAALQARAAHEGEPPMVAAAFYHLAGRRPRHGPYHANALLLSARIAALPHLGRPKPPRCDVASAEHLHKRMRAVTPLLMLSDALGPEPRPGPGEMPPARAAGGGTAPIFRITAELPAAEPQIWRRLEVPADITLAQLRAAIEAAFGWRESQQHLTGTRYGYVTPPGEGAGSLREDEVTVEQVAQPGTRIVHMRFDRQWQVEVAVEGLAEAEPAAGRRARCVDGRGAAPPEDWGSVDRSGVWTHNVLADPGHDQHPAVLRRLGLEQTGYDPDRFDPDEVNRALSDLLD